MSTHPSDNVPEHSQRSPLDYTAMIEQAKQSLKQFWFKLSTTFLLKNRQPLDPVAEKQRRLAEIGDYLRQVREHHGLSLSAIAQRTHIPESLLQSLESAELSALPEKVYIRATIKRVADVLGVDGTELADYLLIEEEIKENKPFFREIKLPHLQIRPIHLYFLYILLVILSVRGIANLLRQEAIEVQGDAIPTLSEEPSLVQKSPPTTQPVAAETSAEETNLAVDVQAAENCRVKIVVDGQTAFEGILAQGTKRTWKAKKQLTVRANDAGKITITINGKEPQLLGQPGQLQEITYKASPQS